MILLTAGLLLITVCAAAALPGDVNGDGGIDIGDAALLLQHSLFPDIYPVGYTESLDFNGDSTIDIRDVVRLIQYSMYPDQYPLVTEAALAFVSNGDGTCYVSGIGTCTDTDIVIPNQSPAGDVVTSIGDLTFSGCSSLTSVTIPDSVTSIGAWAFGECSSLTSVTIPDNVTFIDSCAFHGCRAMSSVSIPDNITGIGDLAFRDCCSLTSITIPDSLTSIGVYAFSDCTSLTDIYFNGTKAQWDAISFGNQWNYNTRSYTVHFPTGLAFTSNNDGTCSVSGMGTCTDTDIVIPKKSPAGDTVTSIGTEAFYNGTSLTSVTIPDSVTSIGEAAFGSCRSLTSVIISDSVTGISIEAFYDCSSLTSINIPDSVTGIGNSAFYGCTSLTSVTIPDSVTYIGDSAFYDCSYLKDIYYSGTVSQWDTITKVRGWNIGTRSYTIHCTDGDIDK